MPRAIRDLVSNTNGTNWNINIQHGDKRWSYTITNNTAIPREQVDKIASDLLRTLPAFDQTKRCITLVTAGHVEIKDFDASGLFRLVLDSNSPIVRSMPEGSILQLNTIRRVGEIVAADIPWPQSPILHRVNRYQSPMLMLGAKREEKLSLVSGFFLWLRSLFGSHLRKAVKAEMGIANLEKSEDGLETVQHDHYEMADQRTSFLLNVKALAKELGLQAGFVDLVPILEGSPPALALLLLACVDYRGDVVANDKSTFDGLAALGFRMGELTGSEWGRIQDEIIGGKATLDLQEAIYHLRTALLQYQQARYGMTNPKNDVVLQARLRNFITKFNGLAEEIRAIVTPPTGL